MLKCKNEGYHIKNKPITKLSIYCLSSVEHAITDVLVNNVRILFCVSSRLRKANKSRKPPHVDLCIFQTEIKRSVYNKSRVLKFKAFIGF